LKKKKKATSIAKSHELFQVCNEATLPDSGRPKVVTEKQAPTARKPWRRFARCLGCCLAKKYLGRQ
jgi:hypothetical protein